jgi:hypothetical protein
MSLLKSLAFASLLLVSAPALAQVSYNDIDPDVKLTEWDAHFLQIGPETGDGLYIWKHPNEVVVNSMTNSVQVLFDGVYPASVEYGQTIGSVGMWKQPNYAVLNHEGATGNWINVEDRYLGLRYKQAGEWHYAWARLDIDKAPSHFTLKDFAVEAGAGTQIYAGAEGSASVEDASTDPLYTLRGQQLTLGRDAIVSVSSTIGEQLFEGRLHANESIDLSSIGDGCVFIRVSTSDKTSHLKVIIGD